MSRYIILVDSCVLFCKYGFSKCHIRVKKTFIQTLVCQLSLIFVQVLFLFEQDKRVEKTLTQTHHYPFYASINSIAILFSINLPRTE